MKLEGLDLIRVMISLWWLNQSWIPDLLEHPVELPVTRMLLTQLVG